MQTSFGSEKVEHVKQPHSSYGNRHVMPVMQLASQAVSFKTGGLKEEYLEALIPIAEDQDILNNTAKIIHRNGNASNDVTSILNPSDEDYDCINDKNKNDLASNKKVQLAISSAKNIFGNNKDDSEKWKTVSSLQGKGPANLDPKKVQGVKMVESKLKGNELVSPITGELKEYADWKNQKENTSSENLKSKNNTEATTIMNHPLLDKLRSSLLSRGANGLLGLSRLFRIMDDDNSKTLTLPEFKKALKQCNLDVTDNEIKSLFSIFDPKKEGNISYDNFIVTIRGGLNSRRKSLVHLAYTILDKDGSGEVEINDLLEVYDVTKHPDFLAGRRTKENILKEFLSVFEIGGEVDGKVTRQEFENYYSNISASIDDDNYFELMIRNAWRISGGVGAAANSANRRVLVTRPDGTQHVEEIRNDLGLKAKDKDGMVARLRAQGTAVADIDYAGGVEDAVPKTSNISSKPPLLSTHRVHTQKTYKAAQENQQAVMVTASPTQTQQSIDTEGLKLLTILRLDLAKRGSMGFIGMQRSFRIMDDDGSRSLDLKELKKAIKDFKINLSDSDVTVLFKYFDRDRTGFIEYEEFLYALRGEMNRRRKDLVALAFNVMDKDGNGFLEPADVIGTYNAKQHPDVISKRKTEEAVLHEFLDGFDVGGEVDGKVTRQEFENYYSNISASIDDDNYFELMIRNAWRISGGVGAAANSANRRVLVTRPDGTQHVEEIRNDLGLKAKDKDGMVARLRAQGTAVADIDYAGGVEDSASNNIPTILASAPQSLLARLNSKVNPNIIVKAAPAIRKETPPAVSAEEIALIGPKSKNIATPSIAASSSASYTTKSMRNAKKVLSDQTHAGAPSPGVGLIVHNMKADLKSRDSTSFAQLQRVFNTIDENGNGSLSLAEFTKGLKLFNIDIPNVDIRALFTYFDKDASDTIDLLEFMQGIRDPLNAGRKALVNAAFSAIDRERLGCVTAEQLSRSYDASKHPEVIAKRMNAKDCLIQFLESFDVGADSNGNIKRVDFESYYTNISQTIDNDEYFELLMRNVWSIDGNIDLSPKAGEAKAMKSILKMSNAGPGTSNTANPLLAEVDSGILATIEEEVQALKKEAVKKFNSKNFPKAEALFKSVLQSQQIVYSKDHPECLRTEKSILACQAMISR